MTRHAIRWLPSLFALLFFAPSGAVADQAEIRAVVVTMFEHGKVRGDRPGELQAWVERWPGMRAVNFPAGEHPLFLGDGGVLVVCTGGGIANATASILALGLDPRFDLSRAYWIVAGIAGGDPEDTSLGSAVWARHVVDGDLLYEIDGREIPNDWSTGLIPLGAKAPVTEPGASFSGWTVDTIHFELDSQLVDWAYGLTRDLPLEDTEAMQGFRAAYTARDAARKPPSVQIGDALASSTYWHGDLLNAWANDWVPVHAGAGAEFMTTNMEDTGTLTALRRLDRIGRADAQRVLVLRTVSNYSAPPAGRSAAWSTTADYPDQGRPALDAAFAVASKVVRALVDDWARYREEAPRQ